MTKERNRLTARFYQLLFFFFIFFASLFFFSFLAPQVSPSSAFSGRCKDWRDQSSPAGFGERRNQDTDCSRSLFLLWTLLFPQPEDHPPPIHCQCPRPTPPRFPLPAAMSLQPSCTSQQANQRFDASMTCRERWTETTGTLPLMGGQPSSSLFPLIRLAQSGMILEFRPRMFPLLSAREGQHGDGARSGKLRYPSKRVRHHGSAAIGRHCEDEHQPGSVGWRRLLVCCLVCLFLKPPSCRPPLPSIPRPFVAAARQWSHDCSGLVSTIALDVLQLDALHGMFWWFHPRLS